jgi:S1-C subfamily serine protease
VILKVQNQRVENVKDFTDAVSRAKSGVGIRLQVASPQGDRRFVLLEPDDE